MKWKDILGMLCFAAGFTVELLAYKLLGSVIILGGLLLGTIGLLLIWTPEREKKIRDALLSGPGDAGDRRYHSGESADFDGDA